MVILDYSTTDHSFLVSTPAGFMEAIQFQNHYYILRKTYTMMQEAIRDCRQDIESNFRSIVVHCTDRFEIWTQVADDLPAQSKESPIQTSFVASPRESYYRGQKVTTAGSSAPLAKPQAVFYRGQKGQMNLATAPSKLPDHFYYRGVRV